MKASALFINFVTQLADSKIAFTVDSQILDGDRWNEVTFKDMIHVVYDETICVYKDGDDLYSNQPRDEFDGNGIADYLLQVKQFRVACD